MLPRPPPLSPEVVAAPGAASLYGPGVVLFGQAINDSLQCHGHGEGVDGIIMSELSEAVTMIGGPKAWHGWVADCMAKSSVMLREGCF